MAERLYRILARIGKDVWSAKQRSFLDTFETKGFVPWLKRFETKIPQ